MRRFDLTRSAKADLKSIAKFTQSRWGVQQRNAYLKGIDRVFCALAENPRMGTPCDGIREGYRKFPHGAHVIFYRQPTDDEVMIIRILHGSMDVDATVDA